MRPLRLSIEYDERVVLSSERRSLSIGRISATVGDRRYKYSYLGKTGKL